MAHISGASATIVSCNELAINSLDDLHDIISGRSDGTARKRLQSELFGMKSTLAQINRVTDTEWHTLGRDMLDRSTDSINGVQKLCRRFHSEIVDWVPPPSLAGRAGGGEGERSVVYRAGIKAQNERFVAFSSQLNGCQSALAAIVQVNRLYESLMSHENHRPGNALNVSMAINSAKDELDRVREHLSSLKGRDGWSSDDAILSNKLQNLLNSVAVKVDMMTGESPTKPQCRECDARPGSLTFQGGTNNFHIGINNATINGACFGSFK